MLTVGIIFDCYRYVPHSPLVNSVVLGKERQALDLRTRGLPALMSCQGRGLQEARARGTKLKPCEFLKTVGCMMIKA